MLFLCCILVAGCEALKQSFDVGTVGLRRSIIFEEDDDYLPASLTIFHPCGQASRVLAVNAEEATWDGGEICENKIALRHSGSVEIIYSNAVRDQRLKRQWGDAALNDYTFVVCPDMIVSNTRTNRRTQTPFTSTFSVSHDPKSSFNNNGSTETRLLRDIGEEEAAVPPRCESINFHSEFFTPYRILKVSTEFYVPLWGNDLRLTDQYLIANEASEITGHYNPNVVHRLYGRTVGTQRMPKLPPANTRNGIVMSFFAEFPAGSHRHEFYDRIGNITTSDVVLNGAEGQLIALYPRHPLLGKWRTSFSLRFWTKVDNLLARLPRKEDGWLQKERALVVPARTAIGGVWTDEREVTIVFPPFTEIFEIEPVVADTPWTLTAERGWFDIWRSRPVLKLTFRDQPNMRETVEGILLVRYREKPLFAMGSHLGWLVAACVVFFMSW